MFREEYVGYPEEYSNSSINNNSIHNNNNNNNSIHTRGGGLANPVFTRNGNGTPVHGLLGSGPGRRRDGPDRGDDGPGRDDDVITPTAGLGRLGSVPGGRPGDRSSAASSSHHYGITGHSDLVLSAAAAAAGSSAGSFRGSLSPVPPPAGHLSVLERVGAIEEGADMNHSGWRRRPQLRGPLESDEEGEAPSPPPPVQRYNTAVQTVAPSMTATLLRQQQQQNRLRNVSLV
jgi:hypothetical protein